MGRKRTNGGRTSPPGPPPPSQRKEPSRESLGKVLGIVDTEIGPRGVYAPTIQQGRAILVELLACSSDILALTKVVGASGIAGVNTLKILPAMTAKTYLAAMRIIGILMRLPDPKKVEEVVPIAAIEKIVDLVKKDLGWERFEPVVRKFLERLMASRFPALPDETPIEPSTVPAAGTTATTSPDAPAATTTDGPTAPVTMMMGPAPEPTPVGAR